MLTTGMDTAEVVREVMADVRSLEVWLVMRSRMQAVEWKRKYGFAKHTWSDEWRSPRRNVWTVVTQVDALRRTPDGGIVRPEPVSVYWTTMQTDEGLYVFLPRLSTDMGTLLFILQPHLLQRYRERCLKDESVKMPRVIREFVLRNACGQVERDPRDGTRWRMHIPDGIVLGQYLDGAGRIGRTFITRDMLRDSEVFQQTQEQVYMERLLAERGKVIRSMRDTVEGTREAERLTEESAESHRAEDFERRERKRKKEAARKAAQRKRRRKKKE